MPLITRPSQGARKRYTGEEVQKVIDLTEKGKSAKEIAGEVDRTEASVRYMQGKLRATEKTSVAEFIEGH